MKVSVSPQIRVRAYYLYCCSYMKKLCNGLLELQRKADATLHTAGKTVDVANSNSRRGWDEFALGGNSTATNNANHNPVRLSKQPFGSFQDIMKSKCNNDGGEDQGKISGIGDHCGIRSEGNDCNSDSDSDNYSDAHMDVQSQSAISQGVFCACTLW